MADFRAGVSLESFNQEHAPDINRYLGGDNRGVSSHPFVKGYFYVFFGFPPALFPLGTIAADESGISNQNAVIYTLSAAEGFTPPGDRQLKTEDVMGMGGVDSSFITGQTIDRNFSIQYRDYWGAPIFRIHRQWTQYLNPYTGGVTVNNAQFMAAEYKGTCMVIQTKPVTKMDPNEWSKQDIIKVDYFDGVFPTTDLKTAYDSNITDNTIARPTVQYRFDGFPLDETDENVLSKAVEVLRSVDYTKFNSSPSIYEDLIESGDVGMLNYIRS